MVVILLVILISLCVLDVVINKLTPTPRMKDKEEEKKVFQNNMQNQKDVWNVFKISQKRSQIAAS